MLTRLYVDNYRCFVNFEFRPAKRQLILGANGSGKSSLFDVLLLIRQIAIKGDLLDEHLILARRTRWISQPRVSIEVEALLDDRHYLYHLSIEPSGNPQKARLAEESLKCDGNPIFTFVDGVVNVYTDDLKKIKFTYPFDPYRSAIATVVPDDESRLLAAFRSWLAGIYCFRINPYAMEAQARSDQLSPTVNLSNFASWYQHLIMVDPLQNGEFLSSLRSALDGLALLRLEPAGEHVRLLTVEFSLNLPQIVARFSFSELSDGQRCLIGLYAVIHFLIAKGATVIIDEPDNFISLREIQPWLMAADDAVVEGNGQLLLISHHPEIINQWASELGVSFVRDGAGPVRVEPFRGDPDGLLPPADVIARGWDRD